VSDYALYEMLRAACAPEHTVGADQLVCFDASNPKRCLAPDAFVTLGVRDHDFDSCLVWEEGTPDVAFVVEERTACLTLGLNAESVVAPQLLFEYPALRRIDRVAELERELASRR
jgi:hypothetical protein